MNTLFKALAHPARRRMLAMLREGPKSSGDIAAAFDMAWPTVTGHLTALKEARLVETQKQGVSVLYRLNISAAEEAVAFLMEIAGAAAPAAVVQTPPAEEAER